MEHLAIMKKSLGLTKKILTCEKKIESRWYRSRYDPWNKIRPDEIIYFKNSGEQVSIKAEVEKVLQFSDLTSNKVKEILETYGKEIGITREEIPKYYGMFKDKKYCILIFLKNPTKIPEFNINKKGFGNMCSWISIDSIDNIKI